LIKDKVKRCSRCKKIKTLDAFYIRSDYPNRNCSHCKDCVNDRISLHRQVNRENRKCIQCSNDAKEGYKNCSSCVEKSRLFNKKRSLLFSSKVGNYFNNTCLICGLQTTDYEIYDCHHIDRNAKKQGISVMRYKKWETQVLPELEKCVYLCKNCHARLHAGRFDEQIAAGEIILKPGKVEG
jgi:hypothetical protein